MEMFEYAFMQRAFIVGVLLALIIPLIGVTVVLRRLSMLGDALSHTSLAGVAAGLLLNVNPVFGASVFCVGAAFGIEGIRRRFPRYAELSISVMLSAGVGLAGVLSGFTKNAANFNSFLFGSIVAISDAELYSVAAVSLLVLLASVLLYKELFSIALDERAARLSGVPVNVVSTIFTMLTAVTVAIAARTVGALIVSSMMVLPVACAMQLARLGLQAGFVGLPGQIQGKPALAQHAGDAGAGGAHSGVGGFVGGLGGGQLGQAHLKQLAALQVGLQHDVGIVALEQGLVGALRGNSADGDHSLFAVDAGAPGGQGGDIAGHDVLDDGVQVIADAQVVGQVVEGIVDHGKAPPSISFGYLYGITGQGQMQYAQSKEPGRHGGPPGSGGQFTRRPWGRSAVP